MDGKTRFNSVWSGEMHLKYKDVGNLKEFDETRCGIKISFGSWGGCIKTR